MEPTGRQKHANTFDFVPGRLTIADGRQRSVRMLFYGHATLALKKRIVPALEGIGLLATTEYEGDSTSFGLVFHDAVDDNLLELTSTLIGGECSRVLGVSTAASSDIDQSRRLLSSGFTGIVNWKTAAVSVKDIAARLERWNAVEQLLESRLVAANLVGHGSAWKNILRDVIETAVFTNDSILILGQSGTGKELIARLIHTLDPREPKNELVISDCSTIVPELSGSEFFGHNQGAFTGAVRSRDGAFQMADGGTLFLDEVGELRPNLQSQLLRVIQEGSFKKVGGNRWHKVQFRLICATNRNLLKAVEEGRFRADLYYRLADWVFRLPTLNERIDDIPPLTRHFLSELDLGDSAIEIDDIVYRYLSNHAYPGNIRELRQIVRRIGQRHVGKGPISISDIPQEDRSENPSGPGIWRDVQWSRAIHHALQIGLDLKRINQITKDTAIQIAVDEAHGNLQRAARKLGVSDRMLQMHRASHRQEGPFS